MSFHFGGGGGQQYIPPPPPPPANPATMASADVQQAGLNKGQQPNMGYGSTFLSAPPQSSTGGKQLTGQ